MRSTDDMNNEAIARRPDQATMFLLLLGAVAGPLFVLTVLAQDYTRPGFDPRLDMLSLLSLGSYGWVQVANFVVTGALDVLYAIGLRRYLRGSKIRTLAPVFVFIHGFFLIVVGVFRTDPAGGFPPGVAAVTAPSWHGVIHALGAPFAFLSLAAGLVALGRVFAARGQRGWALYAVMSAAAMVIIFIAGFTQPIYVARTLRLAVLIGWSAASVIATRLRLDPVASS